MFEYDSDWSDLADDEDPDSNDERFAGNDYPEEEGEEDLNKNENENEKQKISSLFLRLHLILLNVTLYHFKFYKKKIRLWR